MSRASNACSTALGAATECDQAPTVDVLFGAGGNIAARSKSKGEPPHFEADNRKRGTLTALLCRQISITKMAWETREYHGSEGILYILATTLLFRWDADETSAATVAIRAPRRLRNFAQRAWMPTNIV